MCSILRAFAAFSLASAVLCAQDTRNVTEPVVPPVCTQLAAQLSAGPTGLPAARETLFDTSRIQSALKACPAGKAVELQSSGANNAFLIAPTTLPKGVTLLVDAGVTVFASRNPRDYDSDSTHSCGTVSSSGSGCVPLITATSADGAGIMGYGAIDGRGELPLLINGAPSSSTWWDLASQASASGQSDSRARMLSVSGTNNFTLYKITLMNSPSFHVDLLNDTNFTAWGIKIIAPYGSPNTDGIDPQYSSNVTITNSYISDGDDNVSVKASDSPGASRVSVVNDHFGDGHGASIGSQTNAGISNVLFDHISFAGNSADSSQEGVRIKSDMSSGGLVQNVTYSNLCMQNVHTAVDLFPFYSTAAGSLVPQFKNITLQNIHATTEGAVRIEGHDSSVPTSITLDNVQVDGIKSSDITTEYTNFTLGPDPVNFASLLKGTGITVANNVSTSNPPYACPASDFSPIAGELIPGPSQIPAGQALNVTVQVFPTKEIPYNQTYLTNFKTNPNATLAMPAPTGTVVINDGSTAAGSGTLTGSQLLTIPLSVLSPGAHSLTATYSGDSNYASITFGSYSLVVAAAPTITAGGIVNTASYAPGTIAQGSLFSIFGSNLGPSAPVAAGSFPIPASLDGSSVTITQNGQQHNAWVEYASAGQVNAILPSNVPAGTAQLTVTYNGQTSLPVTFTVAASSFGVFFTPANAAIAQNYVSPSNYPLNQPSTPAMPGQVVLVWGTGLGPIPTPDNVAPGAAAVDMANVPVTITVGGVPAQRLYAGRQSQSAAVDNIYFTIPAGVPFGCQVPVAINAGRVPANTTTIAITADSSPCQ